MLEKRAVAGLTMKVLMIATPITLVLSFVFFAISNMLAFNSSEATLTEDSMANAADAFEKITMAARLMPT